MKTHFDNKEKELIREICNKLKGKVLDIDNLKAELAKLIKYIKKYNLSIRSRVLNISKWVAVVWRK